MTTTPTSKRPLPSSSPCPRGGSRAHTHAVDGGGGRVILPCTSPALWERLFRLLLAGNEPLLDGKPFVEPRGFSAAVWLQQREARR